MNNGYEYYYLLGLDIPLEKYGLGKFKEYVKNNPKRFAKGLGMGILGTGMGVTGAVLLGKALKEKKKKDPKRKNKDEEGD